MRVFSYLCLQNTPVCRYNMPVLARKLNQTLGASMRKSSASSCTDTRVKQLDLATVAPGIQITVKTKRSTWHLVLLQCRGVNDGLVTGVAIQTNSRGYGQPTIAPNDRVVSQHIQVGERMVIDGRRSSKVVSITINYLG